jgi:hypothetical protein
VKCSVRLVRRGSVGLGAGMGSGIWRRGMCTMGFWHMRPRIAFMAFLSSPYILDARLRYYVVVVVVFTTKKKKSSTQHAQLLLTLCCAVFAIETMPTHEKSVSQHHSSCSHPQQDRHNSLKFDFFLNLNTAQSLSRVELSGWVPKFPPLVKKKTPPEQAATQEVKMPTPIQARRPKGENVPWL